MGFLFGLAFVFAADEATAAQQLALRTEGPVVHAPEEADLPWTEVVREVQEALFELGFYDGPIDGRLSIETEEAILRYQREYGLIGEGAAWPNLVIHMRAIGRALRMQQALQRARETQIEKARAILLGNEVTRALLSPGRLGPADPGRRIEACFAAPTVRCLVDAAFDSIRAVSREDYRDWALRDLIRAQTRVGMDAKARANLKYISDPRLVLVEMRQIAVILAARGRLESAEAMAAIIPDARNRARALVAIAAGYASNGDLVTARDRMNKIKGLLAASVRANEAVDILAGLAVGLAEAGARSLARTALAWASGIVDTLGPELRDAALGRLAAAFARTGDPGTAWAMIDRVAGDTNRRAALIAGAGVLARRGKIEKAVERADAISDPRYRALALCAIASALGRQEQPKAAWPLLQRARSELSRIERPFAIDFARARLAATEAQLGVARAVDTALGIANAALKARTLWRIAAIREDNGDEAGAAAARARAETATQEVRSAYDRVAILTDAVVARAATGQTDRLRTLFRHALETTQGIRTRWWRARALSRLATALFALEEAEATP